jgi:hypothetical protein
LFRANVKNFEGFNCGGMKWIEMGIAIKKAIVEEEKREMDAKRKKRRFLRRWKIENEMKTGISAGKYWRDEFQCFRRVADRLPFPCW